LDESFHALRIAAKPGLSLERFSQEKRLYIYCGSLGPPPAFIRPIFFSSSKNTQIAQRGVWVFPVGLLQGVVRLVVDGWGSHLDAQHAADAALWIFKRPVKGLYRATM
jgi:hypothetical protein